MMAPINEGSFAAVKTNWHQLLAAVSKRFFHVATKQKLLKDITSKVRIFSRQENECHSLQIALLSEQEVWHKTHSASSSLHRLSVEDLVNYS